MNTRPLIRSDYLGIKLEPELKRALLERASKEGCDVSAVTRRALRNHLYEPNAKREKAKK